MSRCNDTTLYGDNGEAVLVLSLLTGLQPLRVAVALRGARCSLPCPF